MSAHASNCPEAATIVNGAPEKVISIGLCSPSITSSESSWTITSSGSPEIDSAIATSSTGLLSVRLNLGENSVSSDWSS